MQGPGVPFAGRVLFGRCSVMGVVLDQRIVLPAWCNL